MVATLLAAVSVAFVAQLPVRGLPAHESPVLGIYLRSYVADGRSSSAVGDHGDDRFESHVYADAGLCRSGASNNPVWGSPEFAWHFTGQVLQRDGDELHVQITWVRQWSGGRRLENGPRGALHVTMRPGDRLLLDAIAPPAAGACGRVEARLEALVADDVFKMLFQPKEIQFQPLARPGTTPPAGFAGVMRRLAELWLVHTLPDGSESTQAQTTAIDAAGRPFEFPPVRIAGDAGPVAVSVAGRVGVVNESGRERLHLRLERDLSAADGSPIAAGGTAKTIDAPRSGQVVSFELPPPRSPRAAAAGDRFAVRLRLSDLPGRER